MNLMSARKYYKYLFMIIVHVSTINPTSTIYFRILVTP